MTKNKSLVKMINAYDFFLHGDSRHYWYSIVKKGYLGDMRNRNSHHIKMSHESTSHNLFSNTDFETIMRI